ncbi:MAG: AarF/UbiB family protein, partial [Pseudomonadota bacterium]
MDIIKTSKAIGQTMRNVGRLKEIATVFARNGFDEFISTGITAHIPDFVLPSSKIKLREEAKGDGSQGSKQWQQVIGYRLRLCFEELGPTFVKFGQLLSTREDLLDPSFIKEIKLLKDQVKGIPYEEAKLQIEKNLGKAINQVFRSIDPVAIGTASIGVVYRGVLLDGKEVVI